MTTREACRHAYDMAVKYGKPGGAQAHVEDGTKVVTIGGRKFTGRTWREALNSAEIHLLDERRQREK